MPLDYHVACPFAALAYCIAQVAMPVGCAYLDMVAFIVTLRVSVVAMRIRAPFITGVVGQK
jgi:hypothetical protein